MRRFAVLALLFGLGCPPPAQEKPGTPANPVKTCTEIGQVCKTGDAPLGVCGKATPCDKPGGCFNCVPQH